MRSTKGEKGITLVALIITIIVLLILAVVAIREVTNDGIIDHAKNAKEQYIAAQENENAMLNNLLGYLNENVPNEDKTDGSEEEGETGTEEPPVQQEPTVTVVGDTNSDNKLGEGETWTLTLKDTQGNTIEGVTYTSNNSDVATVNSTSGAVTGVTNGTATITLTYTVSGETKTKTHNVTVVKNTVVVSGDSNGDGKINYNETWTLALKDAEGNAISGVSYSANDTSIATVNSSGVVTGVSHGTTTITLSYTANGEVISKEYDVNVVEYVKTISFRLENRQLQVGDTTRVIVTTSPTINPKGTFSYVSSDTSVVTIDEKGMVTVVGAGNSYVTVIYTPPDGSDGTSIREGGLNINIQPSIEDPDPDI